MCANVRVCVLVCHFVVRVVGFCCCCSTAFCGPRDGVDFDWDWVCARPGSGSGTVPVPGLGLLWLIVVATDKRCQLLLPTDEGEEEGTLKAWGV